jgi:putative membrane protein
MPLTEKERQQINTIVARFEADTGIQAVAAVTSKADAYPEIPWKAYAMGSGVGAAFAALNPLIISGWSHAGIIAFDAMLILSSGAALSLLAAFVPAIGRLFLDRLRAQGEAEQYAQSMFLERELFRTRSRRAVLVVLCRFERIAIVITDKGLAQYAPPSALHAIGGEAKSVLARGGGADTVAAFESVFGSIKALLAHGGLEAAPLEANEIDDDVVTERGT